MKQLTLLEACGLIGIVYPVTENELNRTALRLNQELASTPLRINVEHERFWKDAIKAGRAARLAALAGGRGEK